MRNVVTGGFVDLSPESRAVAAAIVSFVIVWFATPLAIRVAARTGFYDHPRGYRAHTAPTPYLGGAAVLTGFILTAIAFGSGAGHFGPVVACAGALAVLGAIDDRHAVRPSHRVLAELAAAGVLTLTGLGWTFLHSHLEEFLLNAIWIIGFTNALNLMDNMDGAAATVGGVCAAAIATLAAIESDGELAVFAIALAGACFAFLRYNLPARGSARIFLGDGGSMPIGFLLGACAANLPNQGQMGWPILLGAGLVLGLPFLDTMLVIVARTRRKVSVLTGGRDHLTHRLHARLGSTRAVAFALAGSQVLIATIGIAAIQMGRTPVILAAAISLAAGAGVIAVLESPRWNAPASAGGDQIGSLDVTSTGSPRMRLEQ
jgi:UDP-GlcNAc:undecaprenyl-phosphate/decaprenyl-phosphate GlcNAc-1-phosphate transferase